MFAAHYQLDNLCAFVDVNGLQIDGPTEKVMNSAPLCDKFRAFGWHTIDIDGHDFEQIAAALQEAGQTVGQPTMILARCVKGKGVSFMENQVGWHGKAPKQEEYEQAVAEIKAAAGL